MKNQQAYFRSGHCYLDRDEDKYVRNIIEKFLEISCLKKDDEILELGCGSGRFTIPILRRGYRLICMDTSGSLLERLRQKMLTDMDQELIHGDINTLDNEYGDRFDCVIGFFILHHISDLENTLKGIFKVLKNDGKAVFLEPNPFNPLYYLQMLLYKDMAWHGEKGILNMRYKKLKRLFGTAGFRRFKMTRFGFFPPFIVNTGFGLKLEQRLEKISFINRILPFQIIEVSK